MEDLGFNAEVSMNFRRRDLVVSVAIVFNSIAAQDIGRTAPMSVTSVQDVGVRSLGIALSRMHGHVG
eukprot:scaffold1682_cov154-Skeletonema_marinoi.AAC.7